MIKASKGNIKVPAPKLAREAKVDIEPLRHLAEETEPQIPADRASLLLHVGLRAQEVLPHAAAPQSKLLSQAESYGVKRLAELFVGAFQAFGSAEKALFWLREPKPRYNGKTPYEFVMNDKTGTHLAEAVEYLAQIEYGMFA